MSPILTVGPGTTPACPAEVPLHWDMVPAGVTDGDKFRLLFMTSTRTNAQSSEPDYYNEFVQDLIRGKHLSLPEQCIEEFKAVVKAGSTDASVNINADSRITDVEVYWLKGKKLADDYADFWDDSWDAQNEDNDLRDEAGDQIPGNQISSLRTWTGRGNSLGSNNPTYGIPATNRKTTREGTVGKSTKLRLYGISPVFTAKSSAAAPTGCDGRVPGDWPLKPKGLTVDGTFRLLFVTSEKYYGTYDEIGTYDYFAGQAASSSTDAKIQECAHMFRSVLSTGAIDARAHIGEVSAISGTWWLGGKKHTAENATNFWSRVPVRSEFTDESGSEEGGAGGYPIWTGTRAQGQPGAKADKGYLGSWEYNSHTGFGPNDIYAVVVVPGGSPTRRQETIRGNQLPFMVISPIFVVADAATLADNPEITIAGGSNVAEGTAAEFTLTADPAPAKNLDISITIADASGSSEFLDSGVAKSQTVTIAAADNGTKTFTVATDDDAVDEPNGDIAVTLSNGAGYEIGSPSSAMVTVEDNDDAGVTISENAVTVTEPSGTATYTVALDTEPTADVTISVASGDPTAATVSPTSLTFTASGTKIWNNPRTVTVTAVDDADDNPTDRTSTITHTGTSTDANYSGSFGTVTATVTDDDQTHVVSITGGPGVTVGTDAQFSLTATPAPPTGTNITVSYTVADVGGGKDFLDAGQEGRQTAVIGDGGTTTITIPTEDEPDTPSRERVHEGSGDITVTLNSGTGYDVSATAGSATVTVTDDDPAPTVRILGPSTALESDGAVNFTVEASHRFVDKLNVRLMVAESTGTGSGDFVDSTNERTGTSHALLGWTGPGTTIVAASPSRRATYSLPLVDDSTVEGDSTVTVTVVDGTGYTADPRPSRAAKSVVISDDDGNPVPTISIAANTESVTEGGSATFTLTATPAPTQELDVTVNVQDAAGQNRDFIAAGAEGTQTVTFGANQATKTYSIATTADSTDEADGDIRVTIQPDPSGLDYRRAALLDDFAASVRVIDDDGVPTVTITGGTAVTEGTPAVFTVRSSTAAPPGGLTVLLTVTEAAGSDFVASNEEGANKQVVIAASSTSATYSVPTTGDAVDETDAEVTVSLRTSSAYLTGTPSSATVLVQDDDGAALPQITIAAGTSPITEGADATFTVTASPAPSSDLTVELDVEDADGSDFVASADEGDREVTVSAVTGTGTFTLATTADSLDELDGDVTVTVVAGSDYRIGTPAPSASVTVQDDDVPTITIGAVASPITEGASARFTLTANPVPAVALSVNVTVADAVSSDFVASGDEGSDTVDFAVGDATAALSVATVNDNTFEASGDVTVTVNSGSNYAISSTPPSASVTVNDNDATTVQFSSAAFQAREGEDVTVTVTLSGALPTNATIHLADTAQTAEPPGDFSGGPYSVAIAAGETSGSVDIPLILDGETEGDEHFLLTISSYPPLPAGVTVGSPSTTQVTIKDFNPGLTFDVGNGVTVTEAAGSGRTDTYTVVLDTEPTADISIAVASADPAAATVSPATLAFTSGSSGNWNVPQPVTVTGVDDSVDQDGDRSVAITHTGASTNADTHYRGDLGSVTVTVQDDEGVLPPSLSIRADPAVTEGDPVTVTVTAARPPDADISVSYTVAEPTGSDFVDSSEETTHTVTIAAGATEASDTIPTVDDGAQELDGSMTVTLTAGSGYTVGYRATAKVELLDNTRLANAVVAAFPDRRPYLGLASQRYGATEGDVLRFAVRLSQALEQRAHFNVRIYTSGYSASSADIEQPQWRYTIPAGKRSLTVELAITDDTAAEGVEQFFFAVSGEYETRDNLLHEIVHRDYAPSAWVDITDNDRGIQSLNGLGGETITEGSYDSYRLRLTSRPEGIVTITASSTDAGALTVTPSVLRFYPSNWATYQWVDARASQDADPFDETVTITHAVSGYDSITEGPVYTLTVKDDDGSDQPGVAVSSRAISVDEGDSVTYKVGLNTDPGGPVTVGIRVNRGGITLSPNRLTFNSNNWDRPQTVVVTVAVDADTDDDQALISHSVSGYSGVSRAPTVTLAIADNRLGLTPQVRFAHATAVHPEDRGIHWARVSLSHAVPVEFTVNYTIGGSATEGDDYRVANSGRVTIPANRLSERFAVTIEDDNEQEGDETVVFTLTPDPRLYTVQRSGSTHTLTIRDDEPAAQLPVAEWAVAAGTRDESAGPQAYSAAIRFSPAPTVGFALRWSLGGTATRGTDYTIPVQGGTIAVPAGTESHKITLTLLDDSAPDGDKKIWLTLLPDSGSRYQVGAVRRHTITIRDDESVPAEPTVAFSSDSLNVAEGAGLVNVTVELSPAPASALSIGYSVGGTATSGSDFTIAQSGTVGVEANEAGATIQVAIIDDDDNEARETILLTLSSGEGYIVGGTARHTLRISDNDTPAVSVSAPASPVTEGRPVEFTVASDRAPAAALTVRVQISEQAGTDFVAVRHQRVWPVVIAAGSTSTTLRVPTVDDSRLEADGRVTASVLSGSGYRPASTRSASVAVTDNDFATISVSSARAQVSEGGNAVFRVRSDAAPPTDLTVRLNVTAPNRAVDAGQKGARTVVIPRGRRFADLVVATRTSIGGDATVTATVSAHSSYAVAAAPDDRAQMTVIHNDGSIRISVADARADEGRFVDFVITLSAPSPGGVSVHIEPDPSDSCARPGRAAANVDYLPPSGRVRFDLGETEAYFGVGTVDDAEDERDECFIVRLADPIGARIERGRAEGTILDDD